MFFVGLIIGLSAGMVFGLFIMAACNSAREDDEQ